MKSKTDKELRYLQIAILLFQIVFLTHLFINYNLIIVVNPLFKNISPEYWNWFVDERSALKYEAIILAASFISKWLFTAIFLLGHLKIITKPSYKKILKNKIPLLYCAGAILYILSFLFFKYGVTHYRLYMTFISTEILSLVLFIFIINIKNYKKNFSSIT